MHNLRNFIEIKKKFLLYEDTVKRMDGKPQTGKKVFAIHISDK
jgi:hypothetical protein